jgi:hypothetical protein
LNLGQEVQQLVFLSQRFARKKGQSVLAGPVSEDVTVTVPPLRLHMGLFAVMERCLGDLPDGSSVTVAAQYKGAPCVEFVCDPPPGLAMVSGPGGAVDGQSWSEISELASSFGAVLERAETGFGIRLLFPPRNGV